MLRSRFQRLCLIISGLLVIVACQPSTAAPATPTASPTTPALTDTPAPTLPPTATATRIPPTLTRTPAPQATASSKQTPETGSADAHYAELIARVKDGDTSVDFTDLRLTYAQTADYDPYGLPRATLKRDMFDALGAKKYDDALTLANQILEQCYLSPDGHIGAFEAARGLDQTAVAEQHRAVLFGLVDSLKASGDGLSTATAFDVVTLEEEYLMLDFMGVQNAEQALMEADGHQYDKFEGRDAKTGKQVTLYFLVDRLMAYMMGTLNNK